jgi:transposase
MIDLFSDDKSFTLCASNKEARMFRPYNQTEPFLFPPVLEELISAEHPAHMINDLVEKLDLSVLMNRYGDMGQPAYVPKLMLKIILYGFSVGVFSSRKLARACQENLAFKYLAGMETPAFKTFIEFRKRHEEDMKAVFLQTVKLARELGLKTLGAVALDGTKIQADTSKHKAMSYGRMQEEEKRLKEEIGTLLKKADEIDAQEDQEHGAQKDGYSLSKELAFREERLKKIEDAKAALEAREKKDHPDVPIDPKKQISFADTEARCFSKKSDGTHYVYNAQAAVDMKTQVIVENHIEDSVSDAGAVETTLTNMENESEMKPDKVVIDGGYANTQTLESCQRHEVTPVCAASREGKDVSPQPERLENVNAFSYDEKTNIFTCPHGTAFEFDHWNDNNEVATYACRGIPGCTCGCGVKQRVVRVRRSHLARRELQRILVMHKDLYGRRKTTVEPVFGQIKVGMGFRRCFYRGKKKVGSEWNVVCAAFNLKKIAALIKAGVFTDPTLTGSSQLIKAGKSVTTDFYRKFSHGGSLLAHLMTPINFQGASLAHCV